MRLPPATQPTSEDQSVGTPRAIPRTNHPPRRVFPRIKKCPTKPVLNDRGFILAILNDSKVVRAFSAVGAQAITMLGVKLDKRLWGARNSVFRCGHRVHSFDMVRVAGTVRR